MSFCRSRKRYALFVNFPPNFHPPSSRLTTGLTLCQEFRKTEIIHICVYVYIISFPCLVDTYICIYMYLYIQTSLQPESIKIESSILLFLFDLLILLDGALTSLQETYTKTEAQSCFQSWHHRWEQMLLELTKEDASLQPLVSVSVLS